VPGTVAEGWVYDYVGFLVPSWPGGKNQRTAMVGSVTRLLDHPGAGGTVRKAGDVFSFAAVKRDFPEARAALPIPSPVREMLASRHHRLHHFVWHTLRNNWLDDETITPQQKQKIGDLGWAPPRPALSAAGDPLFGNASGEDFLYMHRQMILEVNEGLKKAGHDPIAPWGTIPGPEPVAIEPDYSMPTPVLGPPGNPRGISIPPAWNSSDVRLNQRLQALKSPDFYWSRMRWWDRQYKDPAYLASLTLGELGSLLEWTVHNDMHMRWTSVARDPRTGEALPDGREDWDIGESWDHPDYDHLGEQYSSHVNPVFWRLHGWVDARIEDWFAAHNKTHPGEVARKQVMGVPWFSGKWVEVAMPWAGPMHHHGIGNPGDEIKVMEQIVGLIFPAPKVQGGALAAARPAVSGRGKPRKSRF